MRYRVEVAGKIFEGHEPRILLKRAVEAKRASCNLFIPIRLQQCTKTMQSEEKSVFSRR